MVTVTAVVFGGMILLVWRYVIKQRRRGVIFSVGGTFRLIGSTGLIVVASAGSLSLDELQQRLTHASELLVAPAEASAFETPYPSMHFSTQAAEAAAATSRAEELLASPHDPDFIAVRHFLTQQLLQAANFNRYPQPVILDLAGHQFLDTIQYLIEQHPGILSVIYYNQYQGNENMLVYWPQMTGYQVVYTPLHGLPASAASLLL